MIEENAKPSVRWPIHYGAYLFGTKLFLGTKIHKIQGDQRIDSVIVESSEGQLTTIECDGVLFTGQFTPESSLVRLSHLQFDADTLSPIVDSTGCCTDPAYYAAGNVHQLAPEIGRNKYFYAKGNAPNAVNISGLCWDNGRYIGEVIAKTLR